MRREWDPEDLNSAARLEQLVGDESGDGALGGGVRFMTELMADPSHRSRQRTPSDAAGRELHASCDMIPPEMKSHHAVRMSCAMASRRRR